MTNQAMGDEDQQRNADAAAFLEEANRLIASLDELPEGEGVVEPPRVPDGVWMAVMIDLGRIWLEDLLRRDPATAYRLVRQRYRGALLDQEMCRPPI